MSLRHWMDKRFYPRHPDGWDKVLLRQEVVARLKPTDVLLDLGAGRGANSNMDFRDVVARVCGVDVDPAVLDNPLLHEARLITGDRIPYGDESFDVVVSSDVLEHLERPEVIFAEVSRVLKPGGLFIVKTPNVRHYVPTLARLTPHWFHEWVNRLRGRPVRDTFPTFYRANTPKAIRVYTERAGLRLTRLLMVEGRPEYLRFNACTYLAGLVYERFVNSFEALSSFRVVVIALMEKIPVSESATPANSAV